MYEYIRTVGLSAELKLELELANLYIPLFVWISRVIACHCSGEAPESGHPY